MLKQMHRWFGRRNAPNPDNGGPHQARDRVGALSIPQASTPQMEAPTPPITNVEAYIDALPLDEPAKRRLHMTIACGDCAAIPKVLGAGEVFDGPNGRYQLMHNGTKVVADGYCGRWMTELIRLLRGHHEPQEEKVFFELLRLLGPDSTMVELGSYWAYYSLWFGRTIAGARTILVEPDPNHLEVGRHNCELNNHVAEFRQCSIGATSTRSRPFVCESDQVERLVREISVDDLAASLKPKRIDLLLADVQGAELAMLEGATKAIQRGLVRFMLISTHHQRISGDPTIHQKCVRFVRERGGHVLVEHSVAESFSGDGLIAVSFAPEDRALPSLAVSRNHPAQSLFGEVELDLDEAWQALVVAARTLANYADRDEDVALALAELRNRMRPGGWRG
jgi:FkbM family methyltransferase